MSHAASFPGRRLASIDLLRGAVMILMALDHVRVFAGVPAGGPTPGVFFTRWVTHLCAPAFLFLAGSSSFLYGRKHGGLSRFLFTRGLWLVVLELTYLRFSWTFNFQYASYEMAGVIWVIGWCMVLMAGLVKLPLPAVGAIGVAVIAGHNLLDPLLFSLGAGPAGWLWKVLYVGFYSGPIRFGPEGPNLIVLYALVPWIGVMAAGYAFGALLLLEPTRRDRLMVAVGLGGTALFLVLRGFNLYGDPFPWGAGKGGDGPPMPALLAFLNATKYPASLAFLLMTLGPTITLVPVLERARGPVARWVTVFGKVPFFYYVLHIPLIHLLALGVSALRTGSVDPWLFANHPMGNPPPPEGYPWNLGLLYLISAVTVLLLHPACRWFGDLKARRKDWWLSYL
jgi:uncharacterized membrane protein